MRTNLQLSPHFTLAEFAKSQTAERLGIDNWPDDPVLVDCLRALCIHILEPVRAHFERTVIITSGYRTARLNLAIGGAPTSQHQRGEAADFEIPGVDNAAVATWIRDAGLPYDQLILEAYTPGEPWSGWVHVSYRAPGRREVLTAIPRPGGGMTYRPGLVVEAVA